LWDFRYLPLCFMAPSDPRKDSACPELDGEIRADRLKILQTRTLREQPNIGESPFDSREDGSNP